MVERTLKLWPALYSYFASIDDPPRSLLQFFESPESQIVAYFLQSLLSIFDAPLKKLQQSKALLSELAVVITKLKRQINDRMKQRFFGALTSSLLKKLEDQRRAQILKDSFEVVSFQI